MNFDRGKGKLAMVLALSSLLNSVQLITADVIGSQPTVTTNFGKFRGKWTASAKNKPIANFLGIPYAMSPVNKLRFKNPQPWNRTWSGIREATLDGPMCMQLDRNGNIYGKEGCLYLNVFVPLVSSKEKIPRLPVVVYVHGGGFNTGNISSNRFAPDYILDQEMVLVTVNYRLGVIGFFSTGNKASPGNYGIKDVLTALRWIQENIHHFEGDPNSVTLVGQSAGAAIVHFLALNKKSEGLFHRYVLYSGSALSPWANHPRKIIRKASLEMGTLLGCRPEDKRFVEKVIYSENATENAEDEDGAEEKETQSYRVPVIDDEKYDDDMMTCMRGMSVNKIMRILNNYYVWKGNPWCTFGPTIEDETEEAVITIPPLMAIKNNLFRDIPWMTGVVRDEGLVKTAEFFSSTEIQREFSENFEKYVPYVIEYHEVVENRTALADAILDFYFNGNFSVESLEQNVTQMVGDGLIVWPVYQGLTYQAKLMNSSVYFFLFSYEGTFSTTFSSGVPLRYGVAHSDDQNYLFPILNNIHADQLLHNTENDWTMIHIMTEMLSSFARNGVPSAFLTPRWPDYRKHREFMRFGLGSSPDVLIEADFLPERMAFWKELMANVSVDVVEIEAIIAKEPPKEEEANRADSFVRLETATLVCTVIILEVSFSVF